MKQILILAFTMYMVIYSDSVDVSFYPELEFTGYDPVTIQVWHKPTNTMVTSDETPTYVNTKVTVALPTLTDITNVATIGDQIAIRIFTSTGILLWAYQGFWTNLSNDLYTQFKDYTQTDAGNKIWKTI